VNAQNQTHLALILQFKMKLHSVKHTRWFKYDRDWFACKQAALRPGHIWTTLYIHNFSSGGMCLKCTEFENSFLPTSHHIELHPFLNKNILNGSYDDMVHRWHSLSSCIAKLCYKGDLICQVVWESLGAFFLSRERHCTHARDRIIILEQKLLITAQFFESAVVIPQF
jgi:hypothetical protein